MLGSKGASSHCIWQSTMDWSGQTFRAAEGERSPCCDRHTLPNHCVPIRANPVDVEAAQ